MTTRRTYTAEFKREAIELARTNGNVKATARDLGISVNGLRGWMKADERQGERAFPGHGRQQLTPEQEEIKRLRKENEILRQEREILKKAAAFFAKESL